MTLSVRRPEELARSLAILLALVLALSACTGAEEPAPQVTASPSATAPADATPAEETPEDFCVTFLAFVDASSEFSARLDDDSGRALVEAARTMFEMPTPTAMTPGARVSLDQLVQGTLPQVTDVTDVEVDTAPDPANGGRADPAAFDAYLQDTCPA